MSDFSIPQFSPVPPPAPFVRIDALGFAIGLIGAEFVVDANRATCVSQATPSTPLAPLTGWWWSGADWQQKTDNRGCSWYNPDDINAVFSAASPDDAPPAGWAQWLPGQNRQPTAAQALAMAQGLAWARIKAARDAAIAAGVTYNGNVYDSDATAQLRVTGAATMAQLAIASGNTAYSITWTLANNSIVTLTAQEVIAMAQAVGTNYQASFSKAQGLRGQITAATTQAQLDAVVW